MAALSLQLLGPPIVRVDGRPLVVDTRKATALLAYLALEGPQRRESLAALLWPDSEAQRSRAALRRTLSVLNRALASRWLDIGRDDVALIGADRHVDVVEFHDLVTASRAHDHPPQGVCADCMPSLEAAAKLHRGDLLQGFSLRDSALFDEWVTAQAEHLRRELTRVLERLVRGHAGEGRFEEAIVSARRHVTLDPLQEPARRRLMLLYAWTDRRADAVRQYRDCVAVLDRELGVQPLTETVELHQAIIEDRAPAPPGGPGEVRRATGSGAPADRDRGGARPPTAARQGAPATSRELTVPLIAREAPLAMLVEGVLSIEHAGRLLAVTGEAGVGKTRLVDAALARMTEAGARVLAVRCHPGDRRLAYAPIAEALRAVLALPDAAERLAGIAAHHRAEAARLVPDLAVAGAVAAEPLTSPGARATFVEGVCRVLGLAVQGAHAGVLAFDDLHHADDATLDLLLYLVSRLDAHPVAVLTAWRDEEVPTDHPWRHGVAEAVLSGSGQQVRLRRLSVEDVARLLDATDLEPDVGFAERLHAETEGLPLAVVAYLQELRGVEAAEEGAWPLPAGLAHLFRSRLAALDETARQLLTAAAVIGRSFDLDTVLSASGRTDGEVVAALEDLIDRGMIREVRAASTTVSFDFSHEKLRSVVHEETSLARRRLLHRRVAEALRGRLHQRDERVTLAGRIAHHEREAGREQEAALMYALAGEEARALYANREALDHLEQALALGHPEPHVLHEAVGDLLTLEGDYRGALAAYETAAATGGGDRLAALEHKAGAVHLRAGDPAAAMARFERALAEIGDREPTGLLARIHADRSLAAVHLGRPAEATTAAHRSLEEARVAGDERALAQAHNILGVLARRGGAVAEALQQLEASATLSDRLGDVVMQIATHNNLALALGAAGQPGPATRHAETAVELCTRIGDRHREAALHSNLADLLHAAGRDDEAMDHLKRSATLFVEVGGRTGPQPEIWRLTDW